MTTPPPVYPPPPVPKKTLWQRYLAGSRQQKIFLPLGALVLLALVGHLIGNTASGLKTALAPDTPVPTFTATATF